MADKNGDPEYWGDLGNSMKNYREGSRILNDVREEERMSLQKKHQPQNSNFDSSSSDGSPFDIEVLMSLLMSIALAIVILGMLGMLYGIWQANV